MESKNINIKIKTMDNSLHEFYITKEMLVSELKNKIASQINIPVNRQRIIFQGKMLKNNDNIGAYKIEDGHVLHLVGNPGNLNIDRANSNQSTQNNNSQLNRPNENSNPSDSLSDLELLGGILRTMSETSLNRRNLRRRILQQRTTGFNMDVQQSLEVIRQNTGNINSLLNSLNKITEIPPPDSSAFLNPFNFGERKLRIGEWVDVKDTIDQWLEAQVINVKDNLAYIHYNGWGSRWDEWVAMNSPRIALFRTHTVQSANSRYLSPFPNNPSDGDTSNIPQSGVEFPELVNDMNRMMFQVADMTQEMLNKMIPENLLAKSEKSEKHFTTKQDIELQHVISGMIEEQKSQLPREKETKSEKNVYFEDAQSVKSHKSVEKNVTFEDAQSVKSHKSLDYDAISLKSMKSFMSASDMKNVNPPLNFPDYISEEDSEDRSEIESDVNLLNQEHLREIQASLIASQLAPLYDRLGRLLIDLAPHMAMLGANTQSIISQTGNSVQNTPLNPNLTFASILTNESGQTNSANPTQARQFVFQTPVMLTPGEVIAVNNTPVTSNRIFGENNNVENHIQALLSPFRNLPTNPHNTSVPNTGSNTNNINSPVMRHGTEIRFRTETLERSTSRNVRTLSEGSESKRASTLTQKDIDPQTDTELEVKSKIENQEDDNMHEISFGTKNSETEIENIFLKNQISDQELLSPMPDEKSANLFQISLNKEEPIRLQESIPLVEKKTEEPKKSAQLQIDIEKKELKKGIECEKKRPIYKTKIQSDDEDEEDSEDDNDEMDPKPIPNNRSTCGRNIS